MLGRKIGNGFRVAEIFAFKRDLRKKEPFRKYFKKTILEHSIQNCPGYGFEDRGWVADPKEIARALNLSSQKGWEIVGVYHMHAYAMKGMDMSRIYNLDRAIGSKKYSTVVIDMSRRGSPKMRAFKINPGKDKTVREYRLQRGRVSLSAREKERYSRQIMLWGTDGQLRLKESRVAIIGAGGLGSPVLFYLAAAGVGELLVFDKDKITLSNLNRQILFDFNDIGRSKAKTAAKKLQALNPEIKIVALEKKLTSQNAHLLKDTDLVIDCVDNAQTRKLLVSFCKKNKLALIHGAVRGLRGQQFNFLPSSPVFKSNFFAKKKGIAPIFGAVPGVIGATQAVQAIIWLVWRKVNKGLLTFDQSGAVHRLSAIKDESLGALLKREKLDLSDVFALKKGKILEENEIIKKGTTIRILPKVLGG